LPTAQEKAAKMHFHARFFSSKHEIVIYPTVGHGRRGRIYIAKSLYRLNCYRVEVFLLPL
ncbi:hypothetical protein, partial [Paramuribaculum intestinale]|uniref:hypothetical protein n=1 Tax=Paramuribaculum intestinale TaxID=2094151 RepID=UPI0025A50DBC